jgi:HNH endonuclease
MQIIVDGYIVCLDDDCGELVKSHQWRIYESRSTPDHPYVWTTVDWKLMAMHRLIMGNPEGMHIDHRDGNPLNNRRDNLRICTRSQNKANSKLYRNNQSGFKGVSFVKARHRLPWLACVYHNRKRIDLGWFATPAEAHEAYKVGALRIFGEFARFA